MPENVFGDFEDDFKAAEKAAPGALERLLPPATYRFICTTHDLKGDDVLVDNEVFAANTGTKGFKLYCEIVEPEFVEHEGKSFPTKGEVIQHVFWVTKPNLPYVKRDLATILGRDLASMEEILSLTWAGRTFEGVLTHEPDNKQIMRNRIAFINPWNPEEAPAKDETKPEEKPQAKTETKKTVSPAKTETKKTGTTPAKTSTVKKGVTF